MKNLLTALLVVILAASCRHEPIINNVSLDPQDSIPNSGIPCDPNIVYFFKDIQPILLSNCAVSGCHDNTTHAHRINYSSFQTTVSSGKVKPNWPNRSEMYEVLYENGEDKMPPSPRPDLTQDQKELIKKWIAQGAKDYYCDDNSACDSLDASYSADVVPILTNNCTGCHNSNNGSGGVILDNHQAVALQAINGNLYGSIAHLSGFAVMPPSGNGLSVCDKAIVKNWINQGAPNN